MDFNLFKYCNYFTLSEKLVKDEDQFRFYFDKYLIQMLLLSFLKQFMIMLISYIISTYQNGLDKKIVTSVIIFLSVNSSLLFLNNNYC